MVACIAYFSMGSNLGWTGILVEWVRKDRDVSGVPLRQIFYVRYIDWFVTTPLLLLDLLLTCGMPTPTIAYTILINEIMVITGLVGALVKSRYKWGYYVFGCAAFFFVAYTVVFEGRAYARALGRDVQKTFTLCGAWTIFLWFLYPISWGLCEGGNVISPDSEAIFYGVSRSSRAAAPPCLHRSNLTFSPHLLPLYTSISCPFTRITSLTLTTRSLMCSQNQVLVLSCSGVTATLTFLALD